MKKLPASYNRVALSLGTSFFMTFLVSGVSTYRALGPTHGELERWLSSWLVSWAIAFPTMYFTMPLVRRALAHVVEESPTKEKIVEPSREANAPSERDSPLVEESSYRRCGLGSLSCCCVHCRPRSSGG